MIEKMQFNIRRILLHLLEDFPEVTQVENFL